MEEIPNPQSPAEFLRQVYEGMIAGDIGRELVRYNDLNKEDEWRKMDEAIMQKASSKITSEII